MMSNECMLTTADNPFNPLNQFDDWMRFDMDKGYNTCSYLARIANTSDALSDEENNAEIERAINEIISLDFQNLYRKVISNKAN